MSTHPIFLREFTPLRAGLVSTNINVLYKYNILRVLKVGYFVLNFV